MTMNVGSCVLSAIALSLVVLEACANPTTTGELLPSEGIVYGTSRDSTLELRSAGSGPVDSVRVNVVVR
jgi:hypothetical protein